MDAKKCDRCNGYFDYSPDAKNFIAFGHKNIIVGRNFPTKDVCPNCMEMFLKWFENPDNRKSENYLVDSFNDDENEDPCKGCINPHCEQCMYGYKSLEERIRIAKANKEEKNNE